MELANRLVVIGLGPGHPDYIFPVAMRTAQEVHTLIGSTRGLASFSEREGQERLTLSGKVAEMLEMIDDAFHKGSVGVLVSGDPGYYSLLDAMKAAWPERLIEVVPGISSIQLAFSRVGIPWHDAVLCSFHGRKPEEEQISYQKGKKIGMLTDPRQSPQEVGKELLKSDWPADTTVWICENLTYPEEKVASFSLKNLPESVNGPAVWMVYSDEKA